jgi:hypothetical protein
MHLDSFRWLSHHARDRAAVDEAIQLGGALMRTFILDSLAVATFIAAMVLLLALGSMR